MPTPREQTQSLLFYDHLTEHQPDLVLLDLMIPHLDGRKVLMNIHLKRQIPVIVVTAYPNARHEQEELRAADVVHIGEKPANLDKLIELIRQTIGAPENLATSILSSTIKHLQRISLAACRRTF
ncbi:response regulator [Ktedonosporobacter rubrisoli]|uniref:response regulator n=1 Tax=Ktedonosporobacter rubrisoli TaxID=2509675 RepID=UPI0013EE4B52|nr:response regulator [Ktedonosporobacter rubrisoli]